MATTFTNDTSTTRWIEAEQEGGGCGQSKPSSVRPTLTQEEINEWMDYLNNEINDNEKCQFVFSNGWKQ